MSVYRSLLGNSRLTRLLIAEGISAVGDWLYFVAVLVALRRVASSASRGRRATVTPVRVSRGATVIRQGDVADAFYLIAQGDLAVSEGGDDRRSLGPGAVFGEIGLLTSGFRTASVRAVTDGRLYALCRAEFLDLVGAHPGIGDDVLTLCTSPASARM